MGSAHSYLGIRWKRMITSTPQPLYPGERFPGVGPRAGLDVLKKREIPLFSPWRESIQDFSVVQPVI